MFLYKAYDKNKDLYTNKNYKRIVLLSFSPSLSLSVSVSLPPFSPSLSAGGTFLPRNEAR